MKKLLIALFIGMVAVQANAKISVEQSTSEEYLINNGYSVQTGEMVNVVKARATNQEYYTAGEQKLNDASGWTKFWRKLYHYIDPAAEDYSLYHHDTKAVPGYTDL